MPPRRRQPMRGSNALRRSERLRVLREAQAASLANTTPNSIDVHRRARREAAAASPPFPPGGSADNATNMPIAGASRSINPPILRRRDSAMAVTGVMPTTMTVSFRLSPRRSGPDPPTSSTRYAAVGRLQRELQNLLQEPPEGCKTEVVNDNVFHWRATIAGPAETPYEGGQFNLDMHFPINFPFSPPKITFLTKVYHCNIDSTGYICLDILSTEWSPALTVAKTLMSIRSLLADPNPDGPLEPTIAIMYKRLRDQHDQTARNWTNRYAKPRQGSLKRKKD